MPTKEDELTSVLIYKVMKFYIDNKSI